MAAADSPKPVIHTRYAVSKAEGRAGTGDWEQFRIPLEAVHAAAQQWKQRLAGVEKPWLCWNVNSRWCLFQQKVLRELGWTPVVGFDPRVGAPEVLPGAVLVDFNTPFGLPVMWPHFPLEFVFLFARKLAFWHSDLLVRMEKLRDLAALFERMPDGETAAVLNRGGMRNWFNRRVHRYWELIGCTTAGASAAQFDRGAGWWRHIECHPNCPAEERVRRASLYYDSGIGIRYWEKHYRGKVINIPLRSVEEGHCTAINRRNYKWLSGTDVYRPVGDEMDANYSLEEMARRFGYGHLI